MDKEYLKELLKLLTPYKSKIVFIFIILIFNSIFSLLLPLLSQSIMDDGFLLGDNQLISKRVLQVMFLTIFIVSIDTLKDIIRIKIQSDLNSNLSKKSFEHLCKLDLEYFDTKNHSEISSNLKTDIRNVCMIADSSLFFVIAQLFSIVGGTIGLLILNYQLALLVILIIPIKFFISKFFAKQTKKIMTEYIVSEENYAKWFGDTINGIKEIKLFNMFEKNIDECSKLQKNIIDNNKSFNLIISYNSSVERLMSQLLISSIYILGAIQVLNLETTIGGVFAFISYTAYVTSPITAITNINQTLAGILPSVKRYTKFMDIKEEQNNGKLSCKNGDIIFKNITIIYESNNQIALKDISFEIKKSSKVAIIGRNGSGKTTLINSLLRLYSYNSGSIELNGANIKDIELLSYRNIFSVVSQNVLLFDDTIYNNICLKHKFDQSVVDKAIEISGLADFIYENSLEYIVGENGALLSGGEKQKIALARAILHNKEILVLDEVTSNIDTNSEKIIYDFLFNSSIDKTIITITHDSNILKLMDKIILLDNGELVSSGSYDFLIKNCDEFKLIINNLYEVLYE